MRLIRTFGPKINADSRRMRRNGLAGARRDGDPGRISGPFLSGPIQALLREPEPETTTRKILSKAFDQSSRQFIDALIKALPQIPRAEIEWRFHFMLGAMFYTMADSGRIQALTNGRVDPGQLIISLTGGDIMVTTRIHLKDHDSRAG